MINESQVPCSLILSPGEKRYFVCARVFILLFSYWCIFSLKKARTEKYVALGGEAISLGITPTSWENATQRLRLITISCTDDLSFSCSFFIPQKQTCWTRSSSQSIRWPSRYSLDPEPEVPRRKGPRAWSWIVYEKSGKWRTGIMSCVPGLCREHVSVRTVDTNLALSWASRKMAKVRIAYVISLSPRKEQPPPQLTTDDTRCYSLMLQCGSLVPIPTPKLPTHLSKHRCVPSTKRPHQRSKYFPLPTNITFVLFGFNFNLRIFNELIIASDEWGSCMLHERALLLQQYKAGLGNKSSISLS